MENKESYFSKMLQELMYEHRINQMQLSMEIGVKQSQISNWLNEKSLPGYYSLRQLANYFKISADQLLDTEYCG